MLLLLMLYVDILFYLVLHWLSVGSGQWYFLCHIRTSAESNFPSPRQPIRRRKYHCLQSQNFKMGDKITKAGWWDHKCSVPVMLELWNRRTWHCVRLRKWVQIIHCYHTLCKHVACNNNVALECCMMLHVAYNKKDWDLEFSACKGMHHFNPTTWTRKDKLSSTWGIDMLTIYRCESTIFDCIWENRPVSKKNIYSLLPFTSSEDAAVQIWSQSDALSLSKMRFFSISVFMLERLFPHIRDNWFYR